MSVRPLCAQSHPMLRKPARPIEDFSDDVRRLARDLIETMYANDGIGLAAPQIGQDVQMFVANPSQERGREVVVVNPILDTTKEHRTLVEGCLSLPNIWAKVKRAGRVRLSGRDLSGKALTIEAEGLLAIVFQHECDHLQGRLFIDRLPWLRRRLLEARARPHTKCHQALA